MAMSLNVEEVQETWKKQLQQQWIKKHNRKKWEK
jgi:hypothetical protein